LAKKLTVDSFDDLSDYLSQFEKLVNILRAKNLEKSHDPLALVAHTGSSSRNTSSYYVTHPTSMVDYEDEYQQDDVHTNSEDSLTSAMLNQAIIQGDSVNIQSRNSGNAGRNNRRAYVQRTLRTSSSGNTSTVQCYNCSGKGHYARNSDNTSDAGPSNDSAFISEVQSSSNNENEEQMYPTNTKIINSTIDDDQIDSDLEAKLKKNVDLILKLGNSLQGMFLFMQQFSTARTPQQNGLVERRN
ncbi:retrovirus-related pol polyprotein from transposon TNT 1-94, partial [Tanacetum coccineum]